MDKAVKILDKESKSGGEKQLLAFGNVLVHSPKMILLDKPFAGEMTVSGNFSSMQSKATFS
ncbi:MAG: hypothetical protein LBD76_04465 [Prevotellaceae bacterium]|jgi:ABC-type branched-subunit amino acid transport system ATPase component|nr:hypothetical protein [Prevotellaceae bacterium]